ncbi:MAG: hypothetical protein GY811_16960 [Myxococcales bacterium]|nr:hypothetical protein [Myxococcales bacterium]
MRHRMLDERLTPGMFFDVGGGVSPFGSPVEAIDANSDGRGNAAVMRDRMSERVAPLLGSLQPGI